MQQVDAWRHHLHYLSLQYTDQEIASLVGVTRQAVNKWHGSIRGPQERQKISLKSAFDREKISQKGIQKLVNLSNKLIKQYKNNWKGNLELEEELELWPSQFMRARLPWLVSDDFYNNGYNRKGEYREQHERPMFGWANQKSRSDFQKNYSL